MTAMTLFTAPKSFKDPLIATIQNNALASWSHLVDSEVLVMGMGEGIDRAARMHGAQHVPDVRTNAGGIPLISSMIQIARERGHGRLLCIINADMIVTEDLVQAAICVNDQLSKFVVLGRRWDISIEEPLEFSGGWQRRLQETVRARGELHKPAGSDFFVFPPSLYREVPDFTVGRAGWDNWMIFAARRSNVPVVDCTPSALVVHQNHDYAHLPGGMPHHAHPESDQNARLAGGTAATRYTILDATHCLVSGRLVQPPLSRARFLRGLEIALRGLLFFLPQRFIEALARPRRWRRRWERLVGTLRRKNGDRGDPATADEEKDG